MTKLLTPEERASLTVSGCQYLVDGACRPCITKAIRDAIRDAQEACQAIAQRILNHYGNYQPGTGEEFDAGMIRSAQIIVEEISKRGER